VFKSQFEFICLFSTLGDIKECSPFGKWQNKKNAPVYYTHDWKNMPLTYSDLFVKERANYHGTASVVSQEPFTDRLFLHTYCKTIDLAQEDMTPILAGNKESVKLVETLAQISCKLFV
jgi:hypothetical protein